MLIVGIWKILILSKWMVWHWAWRITEWRGVELWYGGGVSGNVLEELNFKMVQKTESRDLCLGFNEINLKSQHL